MAEHSELQLLGEDEIQCGICHKPAEEPKLLKCLHFFCKQCIEKKVCNAPNQMINCPTCEEETYVGDNDMDYIPTVYAIDKIRKVHGIASQLGATKKPCIQCKQCKEKPKWASRYCTQCEFICEECYEAHTQCKVFDLEHETVSIEMLKEDTSKYVHTKFPKCDEHEKELRYYCCICEKLACENCCSFGSHQSHKTKAINEMTKFPTLQKQLDLLKKTQLKQREQIDWIDEESTHIDSNIQIARKEVEAVMDKAKEVLHKRQDELNKELESIAHGLKGALEKKCKELQEHRSETNRVSSLVQTCFKTDSKVDLVTCQGVMVGKMRKLSTSNELKHATIVTPVSINTALDFPESLEKLLKQTVTVTGLQADVKKSRIESYVESAQVNTQIEILLRTVYENEQPCVNSQNVHATLETFDGRTQLVASVTETSTSTYKISYTPTVRGRHRLHVLVNQKELSSSPFTVTVYIPPEKMKQHQPESLQFNHPYQCAGITNGDLLVVEPLEKERIVRRSPNGHQTEFRTPESAQVQPQNPQGIATDANGSVYVVYHGAYDVRIVKYDIHGKVIAENDDTNKCERPGRMKYKEDDNLLYIWDRSNKCFHVFDSDLNFKFSFPFAKDIQRQQYSDIEFENGNTYLSSKEENLVYKFDQKGKELLRFGHHELKSPRGLLYLNSYLYVADSGNNRIAVFETHGGHKLIASISTPNCGYLGSMAVDLDGYIYVCDYKGGYIYKF